MTINQKFIAASTPQKLGAPVAMEIAHTLIDFTLIY